MGLKSTTKKNSFFYVFIDLKRKAQSLSQSDSSFFVFLSFSSLT